MLEIPEAKIIADQINSTLKGKKVKDVVAWQNPHKFAFITDDPRDYGKLLINGSVKSARAFGSWVEINIGDSIFSVSEGTRLFYTEDKKKINKKHQMLIQFDDDTYLVASVQMYGGVICAAKGTYDEGYYMIAQQKPDVLSDAFNESYFLEMAKNSLEKLSVKAFLATEQRIPGLGNGVLHDILFNARIHHKRKLGTITSEEMHNLYMSIKGTIQEMYDKGGRDTDKDLFGNPGGYQTQMSKLTKDLPCEVCGSIIKKESYMGGSIYFCPGCQKH